jgi:hypothetical protein
VRVQPRLRRSVYMWATTEAHSSQAIGGIIAEVDANTDGGRRGISLSLISNDVVIKHIRACAVSKSAVQVCRAVYTCIILFDCLWLESNRSNLVNAICLHLW